MAAGMAFTTIVFVLATLFALIAPQTYIAQWLWSCAFTTPILDGFLATQASPSKIIRSMSEMGQNRKSSLRANNVCSDLDNGHRTTTAACPKSAISGLRPVLAMIAKSAIGDMRCQSCFSLLSAL